MKLNELKQSSLASEQPKNKNDEKQYFNYRNIVNYPEQEQKISSPTRFGHSDDQRSIDQQAIINIREEINNLLSTGLYKEDEDDVIIELKHNLLESEKQFILNHE